MTPQHAPAPLPALRRTLAFGRRAGRFAFALAAWQLVGCRGVLGIDDLDPGTGSTESESDESISRGGAAGAGGGKAGDGKADGGKAGKGGASGAGGGASTPSDPRKACQQRCADAAPAGALESYYGAVGACACGSDGQGHGCGDVCSSCSLSPGNFAAASSSCVACITARQTWGSCQDEGAGCTGACDTFADCIRNCGFGGGGGDDDDQD